MGPVIPPLGAGYTVHVFGEDDAVGVEDVLDFWAREGAVTGEAAERRVHEVLLVATEEHGELVGVSTAYLQRNEQLGMDLWYYRTYVSREHRRSQIGRNLMHTAVAVLERRFVTGEDTRAAGIGIEGQNADLKRTRTEAVTPRARFVFIGQNDRGDRVRVRYFPGALAPAPRAR